METYDRPVFRLPSEPHEPQAPRSGFVETRLQSKHERAYDACILLSIKCGALTCATVGGTTTCAVHIPCTQAGTPQTDSSRLAERKATGCCPPSTRNRRTAKIGLQTSMAGTTLRRPDGPSTKTVASNKTILVLGAGPKPLALAAKREAVRAQGWEVPELVVFDKAGIAANWAGRRLHDGRQELGTPPETTSASPTAQTVGGHQTSW